MQTLLRVLRNSFFLTIATIVDRVADFLLVLYLARLLGVEDVGAYFLVVSILYLFQNLANFGLVQLTTREIAKNKTRVSDLIGYLALIATGLGSLVTVALLIITPLLRYAGTVSSSLTIVALSLLPGTLRGVAEAVFNAVEQMEHIAWVTGLGGLLRSGVSIAALWAGLSLRSVFVVLVATQWLVALVYFVLIFKFYGKPSWQLSSDALLLLIRSSLVFSVMSVFLVGANNVDALLLSKLGSIEDVGLFAAAFKLVQAVILFRPILMRSLFPSLVQSASNFHELRQLTQHMLRLLIVLLAPLPIIFTFLARPLIDFLYGPQFNEAVLVLQVLGWSILLSFISIALHRVLLATDRENIALWISMVTMLANVGADILLIPTFGAKGAAMASLISLSIALLLAYGWVRWRLFSISVGEVVGRPGLGVFLCASVALFVHRFDPYPLPFLPAFIFLIGYPPALILVRALSWDELEEVWIRLHRIGEYGKGVS